MADICVLGSGSWGSAIAWLLSNNGHRVTLWSFFKEETEMLRKYRENRDKLPGVILSKNVVFSSDLPASASDKDLIVMAVPSPAV